jgi:hypothetical protein
LCKNLCLFCIFVKVAQAMIVMPTGQFSPYLEPCLILENTYHTKSGCDPSNMIINEVTFHFYIRYYIGWVIKNDKLPRRWATLWSFHSTYVPCRLNIMKYLFKSLAEIVIELQYTYRWILIVFGNVSACICYSCLVLNRRNSIFSAVFWNAQYKQPLAITTKMKR